MEYQLIQVCCCYFWWISESQTQKQWSFTSLSVGIPVYESQQMVFQYPHGWGQRSLAPQLGSSDCRKILLHMERKLTFPNQPPIGLTLSSGSCRTWILLLPQDNPSNLLLAVFPYRAQTMDGIPLCYCTVFSLWSSMILKHRGSTLARFLSG